MAETPNIPAVMAIPEFVSKRCPLYYRKYRNGQNIRKNCGIAVDDVGSQNDQIAGDVSGEEAVQSQKADGIRRAGYQAEHEGQN
jgi:hypothetical protein